ncbi:hypothetical protein [Stenotrophomonas rhizophila]|uniref:hypothetical protein n=1 Tax=Stenotrophomonas rhizophila TaxID=216778 RepID=UPI00081C65B3|nr:hypothetical protein [Stenotrophomonas rhizophila]AOA70751.1 hypothetical protein BAY15_0317 [Stenotrophomonas rhizophila]
MSMDVTKARIILGNLRERIEIGDDGKFRLSGVITQNELNALELFAFGSLSKESSPVDAAGLPVTSMESPESNVIAFPSGGSEDSVETRDPVELDLTTLLLPDVDSDYRVCMDFGTAMSKATFVKDDTSGFEQVQVLRLGIPGDQEQIDEVMLVSSVFIDAEGLIWFGQRAVEQAQLAPEGRNLRMDNIKRALSEGVLGEPVPAAFNPTSEDLTNEDVVLAYLAFFTWAVNQSLKQDVDDIQVSRNFARRFAMPCFPRANAKIVESKLKVLLGEAQILSDTFEHEMNSGLHLKDFLSACEQLRSQSRNYAFIECSVTEPLGVAGSLLSWNSSQDSLALVVDIGAGTSDFSLYRLNVVVDEDGEITNATAGEVDKTARGITEAGNHLDKLLLGHILKKAGVSSSDPKFKVITHDLERSIRDYKESLFNGGVAAVTLKNGESVEVTLEEFLSLDTVGAFEQSLRTTLIETLESSHPDWIQWVRANASRYLTVVLTGGGAMLPMARKLTEGFVTAHGVSIPVIAAKPFPEWLSKDYPDLEHHYSRIAVSLGGARRKTISSMGVLRSTGIGIGGYKLDRFQSRGS